MKPLCCFQTSLLLLCILLIGPAAAQEEKTQTASLDTTKIEQLTGMKGSFDSSKTVFKVMMPRADLKVTVAGVHMTPPKGLASWVGFMKSGVVTMVMGDLVLLEDQVAPVMDVALANALAAFAGNDETAISWSTKTNCSRCSRPCGPPTSISWLFTNI